MKWILTIVALTLLLAASSSAIDLMPTPVRSQFEKSLAMSGNSLLAADDGQPFVVDEEPRPTAMESKSVGRAVLYSALLPGLGQYYNGQHKKARYFVAAELVTWVAWGGFRMYGSYKKDDYIEYGNIHAQAQLEGKSDEFLDWVGFYYDINQYNAEGRVGDRDRPYLADTPENHWYWQTASEQELYRDLKNMSRESYRRAKFMVGVALLNRVISAIDAAIDARRSRRTEAVDWQIGGARFELNVDPMGRDRQFALTVYPGF